jgi:hypothetical protein
LAAWLGPLGGMPENARVFSQLSLPPMEEANELVDDCRGRPGVRDDPV